MIYLKYLSLPTSIILFMQLGLPPLLTIGNILSRPLMAWSWGAKTCLKTRHIMALSQCWFFHQVKSMGTLLRIWSRLPKPTMAMFHVSDHVLVMMRAKEWKRHCAHLITECMAFQSNGYVHSMSTVQV